MRGFVYSFALAATMYIAMIFGPTESVIGFFGGILFAIMALPFKTVPQGTVFDILVVSPPALAILIHLILRHRNWDKLCSDSIFTLFAGAWAPTTLGIKRFLCAFQRSVGPANADCNGLVLPSVNVALLCFIVWAFAVDLATVFGVRGKDRKVSLDPLDKFSAANMGGWWVLKTSIFLFFITIGWGSNGTVILIAGALVTGVLMIRTLSYASS